MCPIIEFDPKTKELVIGTRKTPLVISEDKEMPDGPDYYKRSFENFGLFSRFLSRPPWPFFSGY
jgi:hypothetical protein